MQKENFFKKFWKFLKEDSWQSWLVSLLLLILLIKLIIFPSLSFLTGTPLPMVVVESCSMYHGSNFDDWWFANGEWYGSKGIEKSEFASFPLKNGLNKGDIIFVWGRGQDELGDIIIFDTLSSMASHPIIHRVVTKNPRGTKGDNGITNPRQLTSDNNSVGIDETRIGNEQVLGRAVFRIPYLGWVKLIFFEFSRSSEQRGFC